MHKKGWIFKIKLDVISSHVRYVRSEVLLAQTSREGFRAVFQQQHGQFQSALRGEGKKKTEITIIKAQTLHGKGHQMMAGEARCQTQGGKTVEKQPER